MRRRELIGCCALEHEGEEHLFFPFSELGSIKRPVSIFIGFILEPTGALLLRRLCATGRSLKQRL